jgi:predicted cobalt transporter CbtA
MKAMLKTGALAGAAGGVALAVFLRLVGEGAIGDAVALERSRSGVHHEMFSRTTQQAGGMVGAVVYGVCMGLIVAVVFAAVRHRLGARGDWRRSLVMAATGFVAISLVPFLKYPANPPAVGDPNSIGRRTALYLLMLALSIVAVWATWRLSTWASARGWDEQRRVPASVAVFVAIVGVGYVLLPGAPDPVAAPAQLIWRFRVASLGGAAVYWTVLGLAMGALLERRATPAQQPDLSLTGAR